MTTIKLISAGFVAIAMLSAPAMARGNYVAHGHFARAADTRVSPTVRYSDGRIHMPAPHVGALAAPPDGENCDVGDNPFMC